MGFFFSEVVGCQVTEERISIIVPFGWIFCKTFQISVFLKQLGTKTSWDFTSALREATVFVQVNFDTDPLGLIQIPDAWMRSNTCQFQYFFSIWVSIREHSQITGPHEKGEGISLTPHYRFQPLHRHLNITEVITAESSPLHISSSRTRTRNLWFLSASC